jgi:hypothetical protein
LGDWEKVETYVHKCLKDVSISKTDFLSYAWVQLFDTLQLLDINDKPTKRSPPHFDTPPGGSAAPACDPAYPTGRGHIFEIRPGKYRRTTTQTPPGCGQRRGAIEMSTLPQDSSATRLKNSSSKAPKLEIKTIRFQKLIRFGLAPRIRNCPVLGSHRTAPNAVRCKCSTAHCSRKT